MRSRKSQYTFHTKIREGVGPEPKPWFITKERKMPVPIRFGVVVFLSFYLILFAAAIVLAFTIWQE